MKKKSTGSFYTCDSIADFIVRWAIDRPDACVLEPSFGDGIFIDSALSRFSDLGNSSPHIMGVEIQESPFNSYMKSHKDLIGFHMDFMDFQTDSEIDAIIGNPPYISLKNLCCLSPLLVEARITAVEVFLVDSQHMVHLLKVATEIKEFVEEGLEVFIAITAQLFAGMCRFFQFFGNELVDTFIHGKLSDVESTRKYHTLKANAEVFA